MVNKRTVKWNTTVQTTKESCALSHTHSLWRKKERDRVTAYHFYDEMNDIIAINRNRTKNMYIKSVQTKNVREKREHTQTFAIKVTSIKTDIVVCMCLRIAINNGIIIAIWTHKGSLLIIFSPIVFSFHTTRGRSETKTKTKKIGQFLWVAYDSHMYCRKISLWPLSTENRVKISLSHINTHTQTRAARERETQFCNERRKNYQMELLHLFAFLFDKRNSHVTKVNGVLFFQPKRIALHIRFNCTNSF